MPSKTRFPLFHQFNLVTRKLHRTYPTLKEEVEKIQCQVLGYFPRLGMKTGGFGKRIRQVPQGEFKKNEYEEPLLRHARKIDSPLYTEEEQHRLEKLVKLRRKGKGPPKKGQGRRKKK